MPRPLLLSTALVTGVAVIAGLLVGLGAVADADEGRWRTPLPDVDPGRMLTAPDGTTAAGQCSTADPRYKLVTLNDSGDVVSQVPTLPDRPGLCDDSSARAADGTLFTTISRSGTELVAAYRGGEEPAWTSDFPCRAPAPKLAVAGDSSVWVSYRCPGAERGLRRLDPDSGMVTKETTTGQHDINEFLAYRGGLAMTELTPPALRFVGLDGATGPVVPLPGEGGDRFGELRVSEEGRAFVRFHADRAVTGDCPYSSVVTRIVAVDPVASSPLRWDYPPCSSAGPVESTPGQGVLAGWVDAGGTSRLLRLDSRLSAALWGYDIPETTAERKVRPKNLDAVVDGTGRVLLSVQLDKPEDDADVLFIPLDEKGTPGPVIDTQDVDPTARFRRDTWRRGIAPGRLNLLGQDCSGYGYLCFGPSVAYGVPLPGFTLDYPRSSILRTPTTPPDTGCGDAAVLGLRGSGDNARGESWPGDQAIAVAERLRTRHGVRPYHSVAVGVRYPAVAVGDPRYPQSLQDGTNALASRIEAVHRECGAGFPVLVVGYSQGAHAIQGLMEQRRPEGDAAAVTGAILLASPRFDPADPTARGSFAMGVDDNGVVPGGLLRPARVPDASATKTRTYCRAGDPVCQFAERNAGNGGLHQSGYSNGSGEGDLILDDAASHLAWILGRTTPVDPVGGLQVRTGGRPLLNAPAFGRPLPELIIRTQILRTTFSAAAYYPLGMPTTKFDWDFDGDNRIDAVTRSAWITSPPRIVRSDRATRGPDRVTAKVRVSFADKSQRTLNVCYRPSRTGPDTLC